jgi:hypothetical protein
VGQGYKMCNLTLLRALCLDMNVNADLTAIDWRKLRPGRRTVLIALTVFVFVGVIAGAWYWINHPPRPWLVRWRVDKYLSKKAESGNFKADFPFPSRAEMAKVVSPDKSERVGSRTKRDFESLREEYFDAKIAAVKVEAQLARTTNDTLSADLQAKEQALEPIVADLWEFQRQWMGDAGESGSSSVAALKKTRRDFVGNIIQQLQSAQGYPQIYRLIGQEVFVAGRLLESKNYEHRRLGMAIALDASHHAVGFAQDGSAAARICEGYVLPHLDLIDEADRQSPFSANALLSQCADIFRANGEWNNMVRGYEIYLKHATGTRQKDWAYAQIAGIYQQSGDWKQALTYYRKVQNKDDFGVSRRIAQIERRVGR